MSDSSVMSLWDTQCSHWSLQKSNRTLDKIKL